MRIVLIILVLAFGVQTAAAQAQSSGPAPAQQAPAKSKSPSTHAPARSAKCIALGGGCVDPGGNPCCSGQCLPVGFYGYTFPACAKGNGNNCVCRTLIPFQKQGAN
jgi:Conotoxin